MEGARTTTRRGKLLAGLLQPLLLGRAVGLRCHQPAGAVVQLGQPVAAVPQRGKLAVDLQQPLLLAGLPGAAVFQAFGQRVAIGLLELQDLGVLLGQLFGQAAHFLVEEIQRAARRARAQLGVPLQDLLGDVIGDDG